MNKVMENKRETYSISEIATLLDVGLSAIRYYENRGLISPNRSPGNHRIYTKKDRVRLQLILRWRRFGFSLDEIGRVLDAADDDLHEIDHVDKSIVYIKIKIEELTQQKHEIDLMVQDLKMIAERMYARKRIE